MTCRQVFVEIVNEHSKWIGSRLVAEYKCASGTAREMCKMCNLRKRTGQPMQVRQANRMRKQEFMEVSEIEKVMQSVCG